MTMGVGLLDEAAYANGLMQLIDDAARKAPWMHGKLVCEVSFFELAALMAAPGEERLRFARGGAPTLWTSVGIVHLEPRPERPTGPFVVTARIA